MTNCKKSSKALAEWDMFGHIIQLNFDKQGDSQQTVIGGFFSLIIRFAMTMYVLLNFKKMLFMENNSNNTIVDLQDIDAFGVIKY